MRRSLLLASMAALALGAATAAAEAPRAFTLPNGLRVLLAPDTTAVAVDVAVWYRAGIAVEPAGQSGVTHLMERLMFLGSPKFGPGEYARQLSDAGASYNTFLAPDYSCFYSSGPPGMLETALKLEADRMAGQRITPANVASERRLADQDRRRLSENPFARGLQELYAKAFGPHPYALPLRGRAEDVARLTPAACAGYAGARYGPGNALLTVTGDFDPVRVEASVRGEFGKLARRDPPPDKPAALPPPRVRRSEVGANTSASTVFVGWRAPADSECGVALQVLARALGAPGAGPLAAELARQRLATGSECGFDGRRQASLFYADAGLLAGADSVALESTLVAQVERFAREPLSSADLESARKALLIAARLDRQTAHGRGQWLGSAEMIDGGWSFDAARLARLESIQAEEVRRVAERVLHSTQRVVVWVSPAASTARKGGRP